MACKHSGSLDDCQPRPLSLELLHEREVSSIELKQLYFECLCHSYLFLLLLMELGNTAFSENFCGVLPGNLAPCLLLFLTASSTVVLWATQYPLNITSFLAHQQNLLPKLACDMGNKEKTEKQKHCEPFLSSSSGKVHGQPSAELLHKRHSRPHWTSLLHSHSSPSNTFSASGIQQLLRSSYCAPHTGIQRQKYISQMY